MWKKDCHLMALVDVLEHLYWAWLLTISHSGRETGLLSSQTTRCFYFFLRFHLSAAKGELLSYSSACFPCVAISSIV
jgi:hypothetical protein